MTREMGHNKLSLGKELEQMDSVVATIIFFFFDEAEIENILSNIRSRSLKMRF